MNKKYLLSKVTDGYGITVYDSKEEICKNFGSENWGTWLDEWGHCYDVIEVIGEVKFINEPS